MRNRKTRFGAAILLGPFSWLYSFEKKKDKIKLWLTIVFSILTFGMFYIFIAYPWALLNAVLRKNSYYENLKISSYSIHNQPGRFVALLGSIVQTLLFLLVVGLTATWVTYISLGPPDVLQQKDIYQILFWCLFWGSAITLAFTFWLKKWNKDFLVRIFRRAIHITLAITIILSVGITLSNTQKPNNISCDSDYFVQKSMAAVLPLATNSGTGTAFAIDGEGSLITAYHVIEGQSDIKLSLLSGDVKARVIRTAPNYDVALIKAEMKTPDYLNFYSDYHIGDQVYAIGWPGNTFFAGKASISGGLVSRILENEDLKLTQADLPEELKMLQTDAAINPGNSGGPLVHECGVVGVVSAISDTGQLAEYGFVSEQGIGYAISAETTQKVLGL